MNKKILPAVTSATVYFTSLCNSGCGTCDIWKETKREEFPLDAFREIIRLPWLEETTWALIGGEFTVYSNYVEVIKELNDLGRDYYFITNGILPKKIQKVYETTGIKNLSLSLDAYGEDHDKLRGASNNFAKIVQIVDWVAMNHPETKLRLCYTMSNLNSRTDLKQVIYFARERGLDLKLGIATSSEIFLTHTEKSEILLTTDELYQFEDLVEDCLQKDEPYLQLYRAWKRGMVPPCDGIKEHLVLMYDGRVMLCENKSLTLGNIFVPPMSPADTLTHIWHSPRVRQILDEYQMCNECWMSCMRKADAKRIPVEQINAIQSTYGYRNFKVIPDVEALNQ